MSARSKPGTAEIGVDPAAEIVRGHRRTGPGREGQPDRAVYRPQRDRVVSAQVLEIRFQAAIDGGEISLPGEFTRPNTPVYAGRLHRSGDAIDREPAVDQPDILQV